MDKNDKRGIISNSVALLCLFGVCGALGLTRFAVLALAVQWGTFAVHGFPQNSEKFYDASGSATHFSLVLASLVGSSDALHPRGIILSLFCAVWFTRLGSFLFARILRDGRDERFNELKKSSIRFLGAWTIQALWVTLLNLPILILNNKADQVGLGAQDALGWALWGSGFILEAISDTQKFVFRSSEANKGRFITSGLWSYSRHPNYLGEHMMWIGVCISGSTVWEGVEFLGWLSVGITVLLLWKLTGVPVLEKAADEKWGTEIAYQHYKKHTSLFLLGSPAPPLAKKDS